MFCVSNLHGLLHCTTFASQSSLLAAANHPTALPDWCPAPIATRACLLTKTAKTTPFSVNLARSLVTYRAAQLGCLFRSDEHCLHGLQAFKQWLLLLLQLTAVPIYGKMAGAVGNYNAHISAYPNVAWDTVADEFVSGLGLQLNPYVTQVGA